MTKPMLIRQSPMTRRWYAFTNYEWLDAEHNALVIKGQKRDVTGEIERIIAEVEEQIKNVSTGEANGWISVEERPTEQQIAAHKGWFHVANESTKRQDIAKYLKGEFMGHALQFNEVTHWRELPPAPTSVPQAAVYSRPECPFNYCDTKAPHDECKEKCRHAESQGSSEETAFRKAMSKPAEVWYPCGCKASAGAPKYCPEHHCPVCHKNTIEYVQGTRHFDGTELCVPQAEPPK